MSILVRPLPTRRGLGAATVAALALASDERGSHAVPSLRLAYGLDSDALALDDHRHGRRNGAGSRLAPHRCGPEWGPARVG